LGTSVVSFGDVAPEVMNTSPWSAATGAAASTMSVSESPSTAEIDGFAAISSPVAAAARSGLLPGSATTSSTFRPSTPPSALACATASSAPCSEGRSNTACGPLEL
jgi:hypothetical protein